MSLEQCSAERMDVAIVEAIDPASPTLGGGETYSCNLVDYLLKTSVRVLFVGVSPSNTGSTRNGLTFVPVSTSSSLGNFGFVLRLMTSRAFTKVPRGAIVNVQRPEYALPFVIFCPKNPKVITLHGRILYGVRLKKPRVVALAYGIVEALCLRQSAAIIAVDEGTREFYERAYPWVRKKIRVIPIGIDLTNFKVLDRDSLRKKWGFKTTERVIMFVGRLEMEKDLGFLIEGFRMISSRMADAKLVLVGDGGERRRLEDLARDLIPHKVVFMGAQRPDCMPEILNCADVLALCSLYEGSPTVVREALACGVPVVTTPVGDVAEVIRDTVVGRIVPKDAVRYSSAIVEVLTRERGQVEETRRRCIEVATQFGFDRSGARTAKVYDELLTRKEDGLQGQ